MRWTGWVMAATLTSAITAAVLVSCSAYRSDSAGPGGGMTVEQKVARGRYLLTVSGCGDCHTPGTLYGAPDTTKLFSGSELGWRGPWGVTYASNITPDQITGIGSWTEEQIVTAIRQGRRPDNSPILPPMPWPNFAHFSDEDAYAIAAALQAAVPITHNVPARLPPDSPRGAHALVFPPPPAWDASALPAPAADGSAGQKH